MFPRTGIKSKIPDINAGRDRPRCRSYKLLLERIRSPCNPHPRQQYQNQQHSQPLLCDHGNASSFHGKPLTAKPQTSIHRRDRGERKKSLTAEGAEKAFFHIPKQQHYFLLLALRKTSALSAEQLDCGGVVISIIPLPACNAVINRTAYGQRDRTAATLLRAKCLV